LIPLEQEDKLCNMLFDHKFSVLRSGETFKIKTAEVDSTKEIVIDSEDEDAENKSCLNHR
jgi:hypothetical protein